YLDQFYQKPDISLTPHVLKDGSDSVGGLGALNRVYLNIGLFSEEWLLHFNPLVGGKRITPIKIADADKNSSYWQATTQQTPDMALFFLKTARPGQARPRQDRVRRELRALPFQQAAAQPVYVGRAVQGRTDYREYRRLF